MSKPSRVLFFATLGVSSVSLPACKDAKVVAEGEQTMVTKRAPPRGREIRLPVDSRGLTAPYIPAQCYAKTRDDEADAGQARNGCYACHHDSQRPNAVDDADLQLEYSFARPALENPWRNLFVDRRERVAAIEDAEILAWVREDNYARSSDGPALAVRLTDEFPPLWDQNANGRWDGFVPDAGFVFDEAGWDLDAEGRPTGWRAFAYRPFPGLFWPTNGSMGDALIRLPVAFRRDAEGREDRRVYALNLAILEALISRRDVQIPATEEAALGVDLDKDGSFGVATKVRYAWAPRKGEEMSWVGEAGRLQAAGELPLAAGLYPEGTEFLHSVRYLDVADGELRMAARMKELRYAKKRRWLTYSEIEQAYAAEAKEKSDFPDRLRTAWGDFERGIPNGQGWVFSGFIEDAYGDLRPQTVGEARACVGCHGGIGATQDSIFSFGRKLAPGSAHAEGWFHPSQHDLAGVPDAPGRHGEGEYATWLRATRAGDDLRGNEELAAKAFGEDGELREAFAAQLAEDIRVVLLPSAARALELDKAYRLHVEDQDYVWGRDANAASLRESVWERVPLGTRTGVEEARRGDSWQGLTPIAAGAPS